MVNQVEDDSSLYDKAHLSSGAVAIVSTQVLGLMVSVLTFLLLPRFLGATNWGIYVVWVSLWGVATQLLESGGGIVMNRYLPILRQERP